MANPENKKKSIEKAKTVRLSKREFKGDGNDTIEKKRLDDQDGTQILGTVIDLKERKHTEANPQFLIHIAEQVADSVMVTNLNYETIWVNRDFKGYMGILVKIYWVAHQIF